MEQLADFNEILVNIKVKLKDEDKALMLLNFLPKMFDNFKDDFLFGKEHTIKFEELQTS